MHLPDHLSARTINLAFNAGFALSVPWLSWPQSILGDPGSYANPPDGFQTEFSAVSALDADALGTLASVGVPLVGRIVKGEQSGPLGPYGEAFDRHPEERWLFVNGICIDRRLAVINAEMLARMFGRRITVLYNATDSLWPDLFECFLGKGFNAVTEAVAKNLMALVEALCDPAAERVILVSHSQGTIIASVMLKWLQEVLVPGPRVRNGAGAQKESAERRAAQRLASKDREERHSEDAGPAHAFAERHLTPEHLAKLEMYCFANCSTSMHPIASLGTPVRRVPWIESYGNEFDLVARLGVLAPPHGIGAARIEGDRYRREAAWGHLFNAHYLLPMLMALRSGAWEDARLIPFGENLLKVPRLSRYYDGGKPPLPYP